MLATGFAFVGPSPAHAQSEPTATSVPPPIPSGEVTLGTGLGNSWLGLRPRLSDAGIAVSARYVSELAWNAAGGQRRDITEAGELDVAAEIDMRRLAGTEATVKALITYRRGPQLDTRAGLGTLLEVQEIYGRGRGWRLTQLWYEQGFAGGALRLKLGRTSPSEDFASFSCTFQNLSFCGSQPGNVVTDYWYTWPVSQWGARLRAQKGAVWAQLGAYEVNPRNLRRQFTLGHFAGAKGVLVPAELGFTRGGKDGGRVGMVRIGGWINSANTPDVFLDEQHAPIAVTGRPALQLGSAHGLWASASQQLTGRSENGPSLSGITFFLNATLVDRRTSRIDHQITAGVSAKRVIRGMGTDEVGLALAKTHVNARFARADRLQGRRPRLSEYVAEFYYGFRATSWLELRPNIQWIRNPGGREEANDVAIIGLKSALDF
jgi:porin